MTCQTDVGNNFICGHVLGHHDCPEDGMGGNEPCMVDGCPCENYTSVHHATLSPQSGEEYRSALLKYIGNDQRLNGIAANGETYVRTEYPGIPAGSDAFYEKVLGFVQNRNKKPGNPLFREARRSEGPIF